VSEVEIWVLELIGFPLIHTVRCALLLLLPLGHQVAHHHDHRDVVIRLLRWYLLLHHGVLTSLRAHGGGAAHHRSLYDSPLLDLSFHQHIAIIEFFTLIHELFSHGQELLCLFDCSSNGRILAEEIRIYSWGVREDLFFV
jgi:hypothetical protein